jgi:16S rRNA (cytosine967-C5)-methyltransferase
VLALRVLERVEHGGAYADLTLGSALGRSDLAPRDRGFVTDLVYGTLRWRGRLDFLLAAVSDRPLEELEPSVRTLLRMGAYQVAMAEGVPVSAAVDQTVRCARSHGAARAAGFINAVLRQLVRRLDTIVLPQLAEDPEAHLTHALSIPPWIAKEWIRQLGPAEAAELARASNAVPPMTARTNPARCRRDELLAELRTRLPDVAPNEHAPLGIELGHRGNPATDPAFIEGRMTIQDAASQLVVELLDPQPGERVLDLCAAPGTKTTAIAERVGPSGRVVAVDRNARRLRLVGRACRRLELGNVTTLELDGTSDLGEIAGGPFDRILVDAPCSGLGTLRRNPDARWRVSPADPASLAETQTALLRRACASLGLGGRVVYSTCTVWPEENEAVIQSVLAEDEGLARSEDAPEAVQKFIDGDGFMRTWPHRHGTDGFFAALLTRTGSPA